MLIRFKTLDLVDVIEPFKSMERHGPGAAVKVGLINGRYVSEETWLRVASDLRKHLASPCEERIDE
jgi:hypothetical protein